MTRKNQTDALNDAIALMEEKQAHELKLLTEQFKITYESLRPINLIKNTVHEVTSSPEIKHDVLSSVLGATIGLISKKLLFGASHNPVKKLIGTLLQFAISNIVSNNSNSIVATDENILHRFTKSGKEEKQTFQNNGY